MWAFILLIMRHNNRDSLSLRGLPTNKRTDWYEATEE